MAARIKIHENGRCNKDFKIVEFIALFSFWYFIFLPLKGKGQDSFQYSVPQASTYGEVFEDLEKKYNARINFPSDLGAERIPLPLFVSENSWHGFLKKLLFQLRLDFIIRNEKDVLIRPLPQFESDQWLWLEVLVLEKSSDIPIPLILVHTENMEYAEYTDASGWCGLKVKKNNFDGQLHIYSFNYTPRDLRVEKKNQTVTVDLELQANKLPPITLLTNKTTYFYLDPNGVVKRKLGGPTKPGISIYGNDPVRQSQMLAGVLAHDDKSTALKIRGGAEEATLLLLEKTPVYKLDHMLGVFSIVNGDYFDTWSLHKNKIPVAYGGKTGGMLEISSDKGEDKVSALLNMNFLYGSLAVKTNLSKNFGIQAGVRKSFNSQLTSSLNDFSSRATLLNSNSEAIRTRNLIVNQPSFGFCDGQWKSWYSLSNRHKFEIQGFFSYDEMDNTYLTRFRTPIFFVEENQKQNKTWQNNTGSISYQYKGRVSEVDAQLYLSKFEETSSLFYDISRINPTIKRFDTLANSNENMIFDKGLKLTWAKKESKKISLGGEWIQHENLLFFNESGTPVFEVNRSGHVLSLFANKAWQLHSKWTLHTDLRTSVLVWSKDFWFLPQITLQFEHHHNTLQWGLSRYKQAVRMLEFENFFGQRSTFFVLANQSSIPVSEAFQGFFSWTYKKPSFSILAETYYRKTFGNLFLSRNVASLLNRNAPLSLSDYRLFTGDGRFYGMDIGVIFDWQNWNHSYQYSLSKSENRFNNLFDYQYINAIDDSRHQFKVNHSYTFKSWLFQTFFLFASGRPYTNINQILAETDKINLEDIENGLYQDRLPNYARWDAVIGYKIKINETWQCLFEFSCFNILNRANVKYRQFYFQVPNANNTNAVLGNDVTQLGRTFNLSASLSLNK